VLSWRLYVGILTLPLSGLLSLSLKYGCKPLSLQSSCILYAWKTSIMWIRTRSDTSLSSNPSSFGSFLQQPMSALVVEPRKTLSYKALYI
jgi:hypothetical protein